MSHTGTLAADITSCYLAGLTVAVVVGWLNYSYSVCVHHSAEFE